MVLSKLSLKYLTILSTTRKNTRMSSKKETVTRLGIAAKGIIYLLIGVLTALAAFGQGGSKTGGKDALQFLSEQAYGKILLIAVGLGLLGYLFYRFYMAFANLKNHNDDIKGYVMRASYLVSGLIYGFLGFTALKLAIGNSSKNSDSSFVAKILNSEYGSYIAIIVALILIGKAIYEFYMAYSEKFKKEVQHANIDYKAQKVLLNSGKIGFTARGIVAGILAYLFFKAGMQNSTDTIDRTDAFNFLQAEFGSLVLGLVAIGVACYGVFMLIKSKYPSINLN